MYCGVICTYKLWPKPCIRNLKTVTPSKERKNGNFEKNIAFDSRLCWYLPARDKTIPTIEAL